VLLIRESTTSFEGAVSRGPATSNAGPPAAFPEAAHQMDGPIAMFRSRSVLERSSSGFE